MLKYAAAMDPSLLDTERLAEAQRSFEAELDLVDSVPETRTSSQGDLSGPIWSEDISLSLV